MPPLTMMIKPVSGRCNLRCAYCFYEDVSAHRSVRSYGVMDEEALEILVRRAFAYAEGSLSFAFQGGEPMLAGLPFYRKLIALVHGYNTRGLTVSYAIQTNGTLVDDEWAAFFAEQGFLVGVSLDGERACHDAYRLDPRGNGTYERVLSGIEKLRAHGAEYNILCVVNDRVAQRPEETFDALAPHGYIQFIPCIAGFGEEGEPYSPTPQAYADFLIHTFERYGRAFDRGRYVSVRTFDNYVQLMLGYPAEHCGMNGRCGTYYLIEADGSVFPCDFYVLDEWRLGNIRTDSFARLAKSQVGAAFREASFPQDAACGICRWERLCHGGCRRDREPVVEGRLSLNKFCESYKAFFERAEPGLKRMAGQVRERQQGR